MKKIAVIVAGGKGERMQADVPKQFISICDKPILMHTIEAFYNYDNAMQIILVLPAIQTTFWKSLCDEYRFTVPHKVAVGGETRFHSVKNGLENVTVPSLVAIHDGVRPLVSRDTISRCFEEAEGEKAVIPVIDLVDSIRYIDEAGQNQGCDRSRFRQVQTPQVFEAALLKKAYTQKFSPLFTDDASVVESLGHKIHLVEGNRENIKVTTAFDLKLVEWFLKK